MTVFTGPSMAAQLYWSHARLHRQHRAGLGHLRPHRKLRPRSHDRQVVAGAYDDGRTAGNLHGAPAVRTGVLASIALACLVARLDVSCLAFGKSERPAGLAGPDRLVIPYYTFHTYGTCLVSGKKASVANCAFSRPRLQRRVAALRAERAGG